MASGVSPVLMEPLGSRRRSAPSPLSGRARGGASLRTATHASLPSPSTRINLAGPLVWPTAGLPWQSDAMHQTHEFGFSAPSPGCEGVRRRRRHLSYLQRAWPGREAGRRGALCEPICRLRGRGFVCWRRPRAGRPGLSGRGTRRASRRTHHFLPVVRSNRHITSHKTARAFPPPRPSMPAPRPQLQPVIGLGPPRHHPRRSRRGLRCGR